MLGGKVKDKRGNFITGAINIHICKSKPFSLQTAELASYVLYQFLKFVVGSNEKVDPRYCLTIDIFGDRIVPAPMNFKDISNKIDQICDEIVIFWDAA